MADKPNKGQLYGPQSQDLRPESKFITDLSFRPDDYCLQITELPAGAIVPLHSHLDRETFYVLSGELNLYDGSSWRILTQGEYADVVSNNKHAWHNRSNSSASILCVTTVRMGRFLQQVSGSAEEKLDTQTALDQKEHFFKLIQEHGYWLGSPEENEVIGLADNWNTVLCQ